MPLIIQDVVVSIVALGALAVIVWRVVDVGRPGKKTPACNGCSTGKAACSTVPPASGPDVRPVSFIRSSD
jgi:hypothetical protein